MPDSIALGPRAAVRLALADLAALIPQFGEGSRRFPDLVHAIVEARPGWEHSPADPPPAIAPGHPGSWCRSFLDPGPPPRLHHFFGTDPRDAGEELELFRRLATEAARCVAGWPEGEPGLPDGFDTAAEFRPRRRAEDRHLEGWATLLHRLAHLRAATSPLRANVTIPDDQDHRRDDGPWDLAEWPSIGADIPGHCYMSTLRPSVFSASAMAIRLIAALAETATAERNLAAESAGLPSTACTPEHRHAAAEQLFVRGEARALADSYTSEALGGPRPQMAGAVAATTIRPKARRLTPPSEKAIQCYRLNFIQGQETSQANIARRVYGNTGKQYQVSRDIKAVTVWIRAGNVLPDLDGPKPRVYATDPRNLDKGPGQADRKRAR